MVKLQTDVLLGISWLRTSGYLIENLACEKTHDAKSQIAGNL